MKCISVLFLSAATLLGQGADLTTGQAARLVIGQSTFTSQDSNSSDVVVGGVSGLAFAADTLFVADSNRVGAAPSNHRVLLFKGASAQFPSPTAELPYDRKCPVCVGKASVVVGQPDFTTATLNLAATRSSLRLPTAVASDGVRMVIADTDHNRVLIWNTIPNVNNQPADVVIGQPDFTSVSPSANSPTAKSLRGPQGVWIQNGKLYIADTQDNRVLIYNRIPTSNGAAADVVLGAPSFTSFVEPDLTQQKSDATATNMLNPVAVTSDGVRLFVTDLGFNRILVWNSIPSANAAPADLAIGQPNLTSSIANNAYTTDPNDTTQKQTPVLCTVSNGTDTNSNPTYPTSCNATLNFPRFALSTGSRLFVSDGGNDRVLVFNTIPNQSGASADLVIGQIGGSVNQASDAADSLRTPMSLAWDGVNLYVSDAYNRRVTVYSLGATNIPYQGVRNAASINIVASGTITISGTIQAKDVVTLTISGTTYSYTVLSTDTLASVLQALVNAINNSNSGAGDPNVLATADLPAYNIVLTAKTPGTAGNDVTYSATVSSTATIGAAANGTNLTGGADAASIAPGTIVSINGTNLTSQSASADLSQPRLPTKLAGTTVYFNGIAAPLFFVSPTQINAQIPWEVNDTTSINAYVRSEQGGGVVTTTPVAVTIVPANPGIFTTDAVARTAMAFHGSSNAIGIISVDGTVTAGDVATVTVEDRSYSYTAVTGDTLDTVRDNLVALINQDPKVTASAAGVFDRILITARVEGPEGNNIAIGGSAAASATVIITAITSNGTLCCANVQGAPITADNPAQPGELIIVYATGLGLPALNDSITPLLQTGLQWPIGGPVTQPPSDTDNNQSVSSLAGGKTADVISATLLPGTVGTFEVLLHLNGDIPSDPAMPFTIAQGSFVSNVATLPVVNPAQ
jgi:uncharacterized protein (TIGR03437 family)